MARSYRTIFSTSAIPAVNGVTSLWFVSASFLVAEDVEHLLTHLFTIYLLPLGVQTVCIPLNLLGFKSYLFYTRNRVFLILDSMICKDILPGYSLPSLNSSRRTEVLHFNEIQLQ